MISMALLSEKPMPAAAQPEYELSIDTTTGMSAPPMGMMISTPSTKAIAAIAMNGVHAGSTPPVVTKAMPKPSITSASSRFSICWPAKLTGAPWNKRNLYLPDSLPKAITDPEKVMAPTKVPMNNSMRLPKGSASPTAAMPKACGSDTAATAMQTAASPISECMAATSSGHALADRAGGGLHRRGGRVGAARLRHCGRRRSAALRQPHRIVHRHLRRRHHLLRVGDRFRQAVGQVQIPLVPGRAGQLRRPAYAEPAAGAGDAGLRHSLRHHRRRRAGVDAVHRDGGHRLRAGRADHHPHRRRRHAGGGVDAQLVLGLGGGRHRLLAQ